MFLTGMFVLLGLFWSELHNSAPWQTYIRHLPRTECTAVAYVRVIDEPELRRNGLNATLDITRIMCADEWHECRGKIHGIFNSGTPINYGDILRVEGALMKFDDSDMFGFYRKIYGIRRRFIVMDAECVGHASSKVRSIIYALRRKAADCLAADFAVPEYASLYRSMILGMRNEMPSWSRQLFVRSSSIHLFSISGLHILFFSRFLEWLLSSFGIPRRLRLILLVPCMLAYVTMSGAAPSALRSYYMMLAMTLAYLRYRQHSMENGLALSGLLLLMYNPCYMMHMGFLYSFILVYCLLRGQNIIIAAGEVLTESQKLIPSKHRTLSSRFLTAPLLSLASGGTVAWFGSVGLMMRNCCFIAFGAAVVNMLLAPLASALVFLAFPKMLAALFSTRLSSILAFCVETLLKTLVIASKAGGMGILCVPCPRLGAAMLLTYYLLLAIALSGIRPFGVRIIVLLALCSLIITSLPGKTTQARLLATTGQSGLPPCLAIVDSRHDATIIQLGDAPSSRRMLERLREMGCADRLHIRVCSRQDIRGAMQFPEESIMAVAIDTRAFNDITSSTNYITQAIAHGAHIAPAGSCILNGIAVRQSNDRLDLSLPGGEVCIINSESGTTSVTTADGRALEITQHYSADCLEICIPTARDFY